MTLMAERTSQVSPQSLRNPMSEEPIIRDNQNGTPSVRGTRLTVYNIMDHHLASRPAEWIAEFYGISCADARAAVVYIDAHLSDLMPKYQRDLEWARRGNPPHIEAMFAESHKRLMRLKEDLERKARGETHDAPAVG
jgi:uncharacterized protein (DUF433 family)